MNECIVLKGCRENNLKNISLEIPKRKITVFTGVSGSGKSSVVFDTIAQEAGRQLNDIFPNVLRMFLPRYRQPEAETIENLATAIVVDQSRLGGNARSTLGTITDINSLLRLFFSRCGQPFIGHGNAFSFNDTAGMCPECEGIGKIAALDVDAALDREKSLNEGAILLPGFNVGGVQWGGYASCGFFDPDKKIKDYSSEDFDKLINGKPEKITYRYQASDIQGTYEGLAEKFLRQNLKTERERSERSRAAFERFTTSRICPRCQGKRYNEKVLEVTIEGQNIHNLTEMQIDDLIRFLQDYQNPRAEVIISRMIERLQSLIDIGLDYVSLTRETSTLSGGESQRVKMVKHLSSNLSDVLYIFDEPSIGLHPRDVHRLNELLFKLRDKGNTVLVVEHDPEVIRIADYIVDMGPGAGANGGEVVYSGSYVGLLASNTLTAQFLNHKISLKPHVRTCSEFLQSRRSSLHNLKDVSLRVPSGVFTVVTGVAGSGKSTLVNEVFAKDFPEAINIDQDALHTSIRSNPATFSGIMDYIRKCFAEANAVRAGLFSYNSEGACEVCKGTGIVELNLSYMSAREAVCETCNGKRYNDEALRYRYKEKNIIDVLEMTASEAVTFFTEKEVQSKLQSMIEVGLGYMTLGQPLSSLSGGECQRLKLARELGKKGNIYILDEPTTGLHLSDIQHLLGIIDKLVMKGNTVLVIEHNLEIIKHADWIIDLGPDGGKRGGEILFEGTPHELLQCKHSLTAQYLRENLV